jgi:hypothetical protein
MIAFLHTDRSVCRSTAKMLHTTTVRRGDETVTYRLEVTQDTTIIEEAGEGKPFLHTLGGGENAYDGERAMIWGNDLQCSS